MIRILLFVLLIGFIGGCTSKKAATDLGSQMNQPTIPDWFLQKPISDAYYYGIGSELIAGNPELAFENARKKALRDIATEIETKLESNSILSRFGNSDQVRDVYLSEIRTRTSVQIEGHELVKSKESGQRLYVLYRLDRAAYWASIQEKKQAALSKANQFLEQAKSQSLQGQFKSSIVQALLGLKVLEPYADQSTLFSKGNESIDLAAEFASFLLQQLSGMALLPASSKIILNPLGSDAQRSAFIHVKDGQGLPIGQIPLRMQWSPAGTAKTETLPGNFITSASGEIQVLLPNLSGVEAAQLTAISEPVAWFPDSLMPGYLKALFRSYSRTVGISVAFHKPTVRLKIKERNSEFSGGYPALETSIRSWLLDQGYPLAESDAAPADLILSIESSSIKGQAQGGIYITYSDLVLNAIRKSDQRTVFSSQLDRLKGADLSFDAARKRAVVSNRTEIQNWLNEVFKNAASP
ncbi:MAG: LPP20 family lipoprotein [Bacteroidetes bacterium]|nr:LPP20 family lipoprotein [Bacteroidota bacterium]